MLKVLTYRRVSTDDQAKFGFSLRAQDETLKKYCEIKQHVIIKDFEDDYSAKNFDRPEFMKLESYAKANKNSIDVILFTRWDRFSRNCGEALEKIKMFESWGIKVNSSEQPLDLSIPENKLLLAMYLMAPEIENDKNSQRTTDGSRKARKEGCWTGPAPFGYNNTRLFTIKSSLIPNEKAHLVKKVFERLATGLYNAEQVRKQFYKEGLKLQKQAFLNLIRNITYTGKILIKAYKDEEEQVVEGLHEAIIDEELFYHVKKILDSRNKLKNKPKSKNELFPLRGHLECGRCGRNLTASTSTSRNKSLHSYYHCQNDCKTRFRSNEANKDFELLLNSMECSGEIADLYKEIVKDLFQNQKVNKEIEFNRLQKEIEEKRELCNSAEDQYFEKKIDKQLLEKVTTRYHSAINDKLAKIEELKRQDSDTLKHLNYCLSLLSNLNKHYLDSDLDVKGKFIGSIFPEKLIYEQGKYRTKKINAIFSVFDTVKAHSKKGESKKASISADLSTKAPEAGLEPATL